MFYVIITCQWTFCKLMHPEGMRLSRAICWGEKLSIFDVFWEGQLPVCWWTSGLIWWFLKVWLFMTTYKFWLMGALLKIFDFNQYELFKFLVLKTANWSESDTFLHLKCSVPNVTLLLLISTNVYTKNPFFIV